MDEYRVSQALGNVSDDLLLEAAQITKKRTNRTVKILRAAAVAAALAILITALAFWPADENYVTELGVLVVTVYAADNSSSITLTPDTVLPYNYYWSFSNWAPGLPITLSLNETEYQAKDNITFQITVDGGGFYVGMDGGTSIFPGTSKEMPSQFTVPNHTTVFWSQFHRSAAGAEFWLKGDVSFVDIIIFDGTEIIGYAILRLDRVEPNSLGFVVSMVESFSFSASEGITEETIRARVEEVKSAQI